jgi:hypothetical protein
MEVVLSMWSVPGLYSEDLRAAVVKYKRLKLGGGRVYDRSTD